MRITVAFLTIGVACAAAGEAQAKRGGFKFGGGSSSAAKPAVAAPAKGSARGGVVILPVGFGGSRAGAVEAMPFAPPSTEPGPVPAESGAMTPVAAAEPAPAEPAAPKRPWCADGLVVGGGAGFCVVGLAPGAERLAGFVSVTR